MASPSYTFTLTTGAVDGNGNIADVAGWDLARYRSNPVVFFNHFWQDTPIGRTVGLQITPDRIEATIELAPTALAQEIATLIRDGYIRGASPGWRPTDYEVRRDGNGHFLGIHSHRQELIEASIVGVPANPEALRVARLKDQPADRALALTADADYLQAIFSTPPADHLDRMLGFAAPAELESIINQLRAFNSKLRG